ncbi:MAG: sterol desaturase family protein [Flavobacteriales bacterium]|nr:sterol desaturase family protein [Flavobacteriales bacterium]MCB9167435.1 sterol desaturase family protein [Flavobacteriales bacterium]
MSIAAIILLVTVTFFLMEFVAWATHKYVMHGFLWSLHRDHHHKDHYGALERNDWFFLIFAVPSIALFVLGAMHGSGAPYSWIALGILLYGVTYFLVHEIFIHQRARWIRDTRNPYFLAVRRAHKVHHKHLGKEDGECFGMLVVPWRFFREAWGRKTAAT